MSRRFNGKLMILIVLGSLLLGLFSLTVTTKAAEKNVLRVGLLEEVESLNPMIGWSAAAYEVYNLNYDKLITWDENLNVAPALAKEWEVSDDGKVWTFYLRDDVKWQDGEKFTAEDVKFTFEYIRDNNLGYFKDYVSAMEDIKIIDDYTVEITLSDPIAWMPQIYVYILPKHVWEDIDPETASTTFKNENPVGTGAFRVVEQKKGQYVRMEANEDYFRGTPEVDEIIFMQFGNSSTMVESLKLGEIDVVTQVPANHFRTLENYPDIKSINAKSANFTSINFNCWQDPDSKGNKLLLDPVIRRAMEYAINRDYIVNVATGGYATKGSVIIPPVLDFWHLKIPEEDMRGFNLDKAAAMLKEAGYVDRDGDGIRESKDGQPLDFRMFLRSERSETIKAARVMQEWFKEIGINIRTESMDSGTLTDKIYESDFDMYIWGWYVEFDPNLMLSVLTTDQIMSWSDTFYTNPEYDKLFDKQKIMLDREKRQEIVYKMQSIAYRDAPYIVLWYGPDLQAYRTDRFAGWTQIPTGGLVVNTYTTETYRNLHPVK